VNVYSIRMNLVSVKVVSSSNRYLEIAEGRDDSFENFIALFRVLEFSQSASHIEFYISVKLY